MSPTLRLYNTLTRTKEDFVPVDPDTVRMYVCGPTVYDYAHIGNARPVIVFDVLYRLLRHLYGADHVTYARNLTDVDDKINARAARDYPGLPLNEAIAKVTQSTTAQFHADVDALGCLRPDEEPRATDHIEEMKAIIERLIARGVAYVAEEHVLFDVPAVKNLAKAPTYGSLARRSLDEMIAGARVDVAPYKKDAMDFVLWKPSRDGIDPGWPSPAGIATPGRPGWHIECSAMSMAKLLEPFGGGLSCDDPQKNVFDIHGGGIDLVFPHHENEIAQSCCAFGGAAGSGRMANYWMHNGFLQVEGEKMSKSLGNFVTIHELLATDSFGGRTWSGNALRLAMMDAPYRQPINWTVERLVKAEVELFRISDSLFSILSSKFGDNISDFSKWMLSIESVVPDEFIKVIANDINVAGSLSVMRSYYDAAGDDYQVAAKLLQCAEFLGIVERQNLFLNGSPIIRGILNPDALHTAFLAGRRLQIAMLNKDEQSVAKIEENLNSAGLSVVKLPHGFIRIEKDEKSSRALIDRIGALVAARLDARRAKNFAESDRIRDELTAMGIALKDGKDPATGEPTTTWEVKR